MGIFKITLALRESQPTYATKVQVVIREFPGTDIEAIWHKLELKCQEKWGRNLISFDCVMISKRSIEYKTFIVKKEKKKLEPTFQIVPKQSRSSGHIHPFAQQEQRRPKH